MPIISPLTGRPIEVTPEAPIPRSTDFQNYTFRSPISGRELYVETDFPLEPPAPPDDLTDSVSLYDYGKSIMSGGAGTFLALGWLVEQVGAKDLGNAMQELGNNAVDYWNDQLSPAAKRELAKEFITKDENGEYQWGDPSLSTVGLFGAQSLLGTAAGAGLGGGATRVLQLFANPVGRSALVSAATAGSAAAASKLKFVDSVLGAAGFGIGEGTIGAGSAGVNVEQSVMELSADKLWESPRFKQIYDAAEGLVDETERFDYAKSTLAQEAGSVAGFQSGLTTAILGAPMGAYFGPLFSRIGIGRAASVIKSAAGEAAQEFAQSGVEQLISNVELRKAGDTRNLFDDVLNQAFGGAAAGGVLGAGFGVSLQDGQRVARGETGAAEAGGARLDPLVKLGRQAIAAGVPAEQLRPIVEQAVAAGNMIPALRDIRLLIDEQLQAAPAEEAEAPPPIEEALQQVEESRPAPKRGKRTRKTPITATPQRPEFTEPVKSEQPSAATEPRRPEAIEERRPEPTPAPGDRWTADRGAMPGEPFALLDGETEDDAVAAMVEVEAGDDKILYEARIVDGPIFAGRTAQEVAKRAEEFVDRQAVKAPERPAAAPEAPPEPQVQPESIAPAAPAEVLESAPPEVAVEPSPEPAENLKREEIAPNSRLNESEAAAETRFIDYLTSTPWPEIVSQYDSLTEEFGAESTQGGRILSVDAFRELSEDYHGNRKWSAAVHEPASAAIKKLYAQRLREAPGPGREPEVIMMAGGTGAGKTSGLRLMAASDEAQIVLDTNSADIDNGLRKIEQALDAGKRVTILYVYKDPMQALKAAIGRAKRLEREYGSGRPVPLAAHAGTHAGAEKAVKAFAKKYAGDRRVRVEVVDNSGAKGNAKSVPLSQIPDLDYDKIVSEGRQVLEREKANISEAIYRGFLGEGTEQGGAAGTEAPEAVRGLAEPEREGTRQTEEPAEAGLTREPEPVQEPRPRPLEGVPAEAVQPPGEVEAVGEGARPRGETDRERDERLTGEGRPARPSVGTGAEPVSLAEARARRGRVKGAKPAARDEQRDLQRDKRRIRSTVATDYRITEADLQDLGGAKTRTRANIDAIKLVEKLDREQRFATPEEQKQLVRYVGWGGIPQIFDPKNKSWSKEYAELKALLSDEDWKLARSSTRNAHYTRPEVIKSIYRGIKGLGFKTGHILEPALGTGHFIGLLPSSLAKVTTFTGVEMDALTGKIAGYLYPSNKINAATRFEEFVAPDGYFDAVVGNPPFGSEKVFDKNYRDASRFSIHNYFFAKSLQLTKPGGLMSMVVSNFMLDQTSSEARTFMSSKAKFLGAVRLPNNAFKANANTEVTTDIVFFQRLSEGEQLTQADRQWLNTTTIPDPDGGEPIRINQYYADNPDMMIGDMVRRGTMYGPSQPALIWDEQGDLGRLINDRVDRIAAEHGEIVKPRSTEAIAEREDADVKELDPANVKAKPFGYFVAPGDQVHQRLPSIGEAFQSEPQELGPTVKARVKALIELRDLTRDQLHKEMVDAEDIEPHRKTLGAAYDKFHKKFGFINGVANSRVFREDPDYPLLQSLELNYSKAVTPKMAEKTGQKARKASADRGPILMRRVRKPYRPVTKVTNAKDAMTASLAQSGRIDQAIVERIYAKPFADTMAELDDLVYESLDGESWQTADEYLSGNVKAKLAEAQAAAAADPRFQRNVEALTAVQPADIEAVDIGVSVNSPWIGNESAEGFVREIFGADTNVTVRMLPAIGQVKVKISNPNTTAVTTTYGTERMSGVEILDRLLNNRTIKVYDPGETIGSRVLNEKETSAALEKAEVIKQAFGDWIWRDADRRTKLARIYNDLYNTDVERQFNGDHLGLDQDGNEIPLPGASASIVLDKHNKDFVWRFVQDGKALADHVVGSGKTFASIAGVMERKRMGLLNKAMFVVPNHLVGQWASEFNLLYPGANVLAATKKDFAKQNRAKFLAKIATGDWDAVIIAHSSFERIGMPIATLKKFLEGQIGDYEQAIIEAKEESGARLTIKDLERSKENLQAKLKAQMEAKEKDKVVDFDEIGVDALIVDESHAFKNLQFATKLGRTIAGLGNTTGSQRALDMFIKTQYILEMNSGKNVAFLTGTPISNSMAEMFTLQRYLQFDELRALNLQHFDSWAAQFGQVVADWDIKASGQGYELKSRFRRFQNVKQLIGMYRRFANVITRDQINEIRKAQGRPNLTPPIKGGGPQNIVTLPSPQQEAYFEQIIKRAENMRGVDPKVDNMLKLTSDARKMALDMRLIDPGAADDPQNKTSIVSKEIRRLYDKWNEHKGTQLVFIDLSVPQSSKNREAFRIAEIVSQAESGDEAAMEALENLTMDQIEAANSKFDVYNDLKGKLIASGIPEHEIAFIHDANTELQKETLFERVRRGDVRVLLGSTEKMGAGMNVQKRLVGMHHLDAPWRPSDLEQREGRIIRQGNMLYQGDPDTGFEAIPDFEIEINRYAVERTYDARMWQTIEGKARIIEQARTGALSESTLEDIVGEAANAAQMKALASGNPLIEEEVRLRGEIRKLDMARNQHMREQFRLEDTIKRLKNYDAEADAAIALVQQDIDRAVQLVGKKFPGITVEGKRFSAKKAGGQAVAKEILSFMKQGSDSTDTIGEYRGFEFSLFRHGSHPAIEVSTDHRNYPTLFAEGAKLDPDGIIQRLDNIIASFPKTIEAIETGRKSDKAALAEAQKNVGKPFKDEKTLQDKRARHKKVLAELAETEKKEAAPTPPEAEPVAASRGGRKAGLKAAAVEKRLSSAITTVKPLLDVRVVQAVADVPGNAVPSDIEGAYFARSGAVYLVADNLTPDRIETVFQHEVFGHAAIERHPDFPKWQKQIQNARLVDGNVQKIAAEVALRHGLLDPATEAKEIIALMAERGVKHSVMDRIIAAIRQFLRQIGFMRDVSDAEIRVMLAKSAKRFISDAELAARIPAAAVGPTASAERILAAINRLQPTEDVDANNQALFSPSYHGSPHTFDLFSLDRVGTGEGVQAFGHGLYFAQAKEVAEIYQRELGGLVRWGEGGVSMGRAGDVHPMLPEHEAWAVQAFAMNQGDVKAAIKELQGVSDLDELGQETADQAIEFLQAEDMPLVYDPGHLYEAEIPDEQIDQMLDWDRPISEQASSVKEAIAPILKQMRKWEHDGVTYPNPMILSGEGFYGALARQKTPDLPKEPPGTPKGWGFVHRGDEGQKYASLELAKMGVPGIKYFDQLHRRVVLGGGGFLTPAADIVRGKKPTRNIVVFDPSIITQTKRDGEVVSAAKLEEDAAAEKPLFSRAGVLGGRAEASPEVEAAMARVMTVPHEDLSIGDRVRRTWRRLTDIQEGRIKQGILDAGHSIRMLEEGMFGEVLDATDSAYKAYLATKNLPSVMAAVMHVGAPTLVSGAFQPVAGRKGVMEIFKPITDHADGNLMAQWEFFAAANRASRLINETNPDGSPREKNFTPEDIELGLSLEEQYPEFRQVLDEWSEFNRQILDMAEQAGVINPDERAIWEHHDYVPFYRAMDEGLIAPRGTRGIEGQRSGVRRLTGAEAKLGSVFENMMLNTAHLLDSSFKNLAMQRTTEMALETGAMEKLPPQFKPKSLDHRQMERRLQEAGIDIELTPEERDQFSKIFVRVTPQGPDVVSALWDGKPAYYRVNDPMLLSSIATVGREQMSTLMNFFRAPKKWLTAGVTASPEFMLANLIRDTLSTWVVSNVPHVPLVDSIKGLSSTFKNDEDIMAIMMAGAGGGGFYDSSPKDLRKLLSKKMPRNEVKGFLGTVLSPKNIWQFWQRVGASTENATRVALFRKVLENGGTVAEAAYQARDVLNFTMSGDFAAMRFLTQTVPFLNARIQGLYRLARGAKEHPLNFTLKGMTIFAATMALLLRNNDRKEYEELPEWEKDVYWHVFLNPAGSPVGAADHWRIPKPFEVGSMFATVPERIQRLATGREGWDTFQEQMTTMFAETLAFNPTPQLAKPLIEQYANRDIFTGSPIVGLGEMNLEPEAQYNAWTSEFARHVAEAMPDWAPSWLRSPRRLEHATRAYFGTLGTYFLSTADAATRTVGQYPPRPAGKIYEAPIVKRFLRNPEPRYTKYADELYDMADEANALFSTINRYREQGLDEKAKEMAIEHREKLGRRKFLNRMIAAIRKINNQQRLVMYSKTLTPEQKREKLDALTKKKNEVLSQVAPFEEFF